MKGADGMYYSREEAEKEYGQLSDFYKNDPKSKIWEAGAIGRFGPTFFSFDKIKIYQFWEDFPWNLTDEEIYIFTKEDPRMVALRGCEIVDGKLINHNLESRNDKR